MKIKTLCFAIACLLFVVPVKAEVYVSAGLGNIKNTGTIWKGNTKQDYNNSNVYVGALGYELNLPIVPRVRVEAEFLHNRAKAENGRGDINLESIMGNAYINFPLNPLPLVSPYVGAGLGYGLLENTDVMTEQVILGIEADSDIANLPFVLGAEYRYLTTNHKAKRGDETEKYNAHAIMLKLRYRF